MPLLAIARGVATVTLPRQRVDAAIAQAVCTAAEQIAFDDSIRVVVVRGGAGWFCSGIVDPGRWETAHDWVAAIAALAVPVIAAIGGDALAEGAELALACDLRIAAANARFAFPYLAEGRLPRHGATQRLPRSVGRLQALDLLLSGRRIDARKALRIGLVARVVPRLQLDRVVRSMTDALCTKGPIALRLAKEAVVAGLDLTLDQGIRLEQDLYVLLQTTGDRREGIEAFRAKRRPIFRGR